MDCPDRHEDNGRQIDAARFRKHRRRLRSEGLQAIVRVSGKNRPELDQRAATNFLSSRAWTRRWVLGGGGWRRPHLYSKTGSVPRANQQRSALCSAAGASRSIWPATTRGKDATDKLWAACCATMPGTWYAQA